MTVGEAVRAVCVASGIGDDAAAAVGRVADAVATRHGYATVTELCAAYDICRATVWRVIARHKVPTTALDQKTTVVDLAAFAVAIGRPASPIGKVVAK